MVTKKLHWDFAAQRTIAIAEIALEKDKCIGFSLTTNDSSYIRRQHQVKAKENEILGRALKTNMLLSNLPSKSRVNFLGYADNIINHRNDFNLVRIVGEEESALDA